METLHITTPYITLGQLLKRCGRIDTGGAAKWYLQEHAVFVNGEQENRRGKKLYDKDIVELADSASFVISR